MYVFQTNNSKILNQEILKNLTSYFKARTYFNRPLTFDQ